MKIAQLAIGDHNFFLDPHDTSTVLEAVRVARNHGDWVTVHDAAGAALQLLIPSEALLVFRAYETLEPETDDSEHHLDPVAVALELGY
jgi:hypothetical protein